MIKRYLGNTIGYAKAVLDEKQDRDVIKKVKAVVELQQRRRHAP